MRGHRALGAGLLVLAVLLAANPLYLYQHPDEVNTVRVGNYYDRPPAANYTYENLSSEARALVRAAIESGDNETSFHGHDNRPPEFEFDATGDGEVFAGEVYRVEYRGHTYTIETYEQSATPGTESRRSETLVGYGLVLGVVGAAYLRREQPRDIGAALGGLGVGFLLVHLAVRHGGVDGLSILASPVFVLLGIVVAVLATGYLLFRTMHDETVTQEW